MRYVILLAFISLLSISSIAQDQNKIVGSWLTQDGDSKVEIKKNNSNKFEGQITWLKEPNETNGTPKIDDENPDEKLTTRPILGLKILTGFVYDADDKEWSDGTIYDPKSGSTYQCYMWFEDDNETLYVKGFIGFSLIGKKVKWTRVK